MKDIHIRFLPGDKVWVMHANMPMETRVGSVQISVEHKDIEPRIEYKLSIDTRGSYFEKQISASKEELMKKVFGI